MVPFLLDFLYIIVLFTTDPSPSILPKVILPLSGNFPPENTIESEVLLLKVSINKDTQTSVIEKASLSGAKSVDVGSDYAVFEMTGASKDLDKLENLLKPFGIIEMIRGGRIAIQTKL